MTFQSLELAEKLIKTRIKEARKAKQNRLSISTLFKQLRSNTAFSLFGDYPLISFVIMELKKTEFPVKGNAIMREFRKSDELRDLPKNIKQDLVAQLLESDA